MPRLSSLLLILSCALPSGATAATSLSGTVTAQRSDGPEHFGLWEYTIRFAWELPPTAITSIEAWLPLENCDCRCESNLIRFGTPSGFMDGTNSTLPCTRDLLGTYGCGDDVPGGRQVARFVTLSNQGCAPEAMGNGELTFFTALAPGPVQTVVGLSARGGGVSVTGRLTGTMPLCESTSCAALPVEANTWSLVKTTYR